MANFEPITACGPSTFVIDGLADVVKQPHPAGKFFLQTQFRGHHAAQGTDLDRMLKNVLRIAGTIFQSPQIFNQLPMDAVDSQIEGCLFACFLNRSIHLLTDFFDHILNAGRMNASVGNQLD